MFRKRLAVTLSGLLVITLVAVAVVVAAPGASAAPSYDPAGYTLAWSDEFNSLSLGPGQNWMPYFTGWGVRYLDGNSDDFAKMAEYEPAMDSNYGTKGYTVQSVLAGSSAFVSSYGSGPWLHQASGGTLKLRAYPVPAGKQEDFLGRNWVSGMISGQNSFSQPKGIWEVRLRNNGLSKGSHFGLWLLATDNSWPPEIDIVETLGCPDINGNCYFYAYTAQQTSEDSTFENVSQADWSAWQTFQLELTDTQIIWRRQQDGGTMTTVKTQARNGYGSGLNFYMLVTIEGASNWAGDPDGSTTWPIQVELDYARIYAPGSGPTPTNGPTATRTNTPAAPTATNTPGGGSTNIALSGTGYRWSKNSSATSNSNKVAATGINDNNTSVDVDLNGGADETSMNMFEAAGVTWGTAQNNITSLEYTNGSVGADENGNFEANFEAQFSTDGTTWTSSGWTCTPAYPYDASASNATYTCSGATANNLKGVRVVGKVYTATTANSWHAHARELKIFQSGGATPTNTPVPPTATKTSTPVPPTATKTNTPVGPTATNTPVPPTATKTNTPTGSTNIAPSGTGYRWSKNSSATANTNKVAATGINDNNTTVDVDLNGGTDETAARYEAAGVTWAAAQSNITSVKFVNGSVGADENGNFTANFTLQFSTDGTTWANSGWTCTPTYPYSAAAANVTYTCTGTVANNLKGVRVSGQVRTVSIGSYHAHIKEVQVFTN